MRTVSSSAQYTYQSGDFYIRFSFSDYTTGRANYGTVLLQYEKYTEYKPLTELEKRVDAIEPEIRKIPDKIDKIYGPNLIDPEKIEKGKYINTSGAIATSTDERYQITGLISVFDNSSVGKDIISNASILSYLSSYAVYGQDGTTLIRNSYNTSAQYTYESGDYYVRFGFFNVAQKMANFGTTLAEYEPYTEYKPLTDLEERVDALDGGEKVNLSLHQMNKLYLTYNSVLPSRNYIVKLWLSHFLTDSTYKNKEIYFDNNQRYLPIMPTSVVSKSETDAVANIKPKKGYNDATISYKLRLANNAASKNISPRIMVIGDSVTSGYGAGCNKQPSWLPQQYWSFAKMFFEMDKIDGGDNAGEYNALFVGGEAANNVTMSYGGVTRQIDPRAIAKGGAKLNELLESEWGGDGTPNPFYDGSSFSVLSYLSKYRTMDDLGVKLESSSENPAGESVVGSDGVTYTIGSEITSQYLLERYKVCKPTHIVISMASNTSLAEYQGNVGTIISIIQTELPNVPIVLMVIDEVGTMFPIDYPDYIPSEIEFGGLHAKNISIYEYIRDNVENESNGIYLLGAGWIQPTAIGLPTIRYDSSDSAERDVKTLGINIKDPEIVGHSYHPNNIVHEALGYELYSMLKYIFT